MRLERWLWLATCLCYSTNGDVQNGSSHAQQSRHSLPYLPVGSTNQSRPVIGGSVSTSKAQAPARRIPELLSGQSEALAGRIGTFLVLTDVHLDPYYGTTRAHNVNGYACGNAVEHTFGRVGCDSPVTLLEETIRRAHEVTAGSSAVNGGGEPDFILITGDSVRHEASYVDGAAGSGVRHTVRPTYTRMSLWSPVGIVTKRFGLIA